MTSRSISHCKPPWHLLKHIVISWPQWHLTCRCILLLSALHSPLIVYWLTQSSLESNKRMPLRKQKNNNSWLIEWHLDVHSFMRLCLFEENLPKPSRKTLLQYSGPKPHLVPFLLTVWGWSALLIINVVKWKCLGCVVCHFSFLSPVAVTSCCVWRPIG